MREVSISWNEFEWEANLDGAACGYEFSWRHTTPAPRFKNIGLLATGGSGRDGLISILLF